MQTSTQLMQLGRRQLLRSPRAFSSPVNLGRRAGAPGPVCSTAAGATVATAAEPQAAGAPEKATGEKVAQRKRILSGVQPTGRPTLGNYLGAMKNWVALQESYDNYFCVVDLHAITVPHDPVELRAATRSMAATYIAAGIDPERATIFVQSHVPAHAELAWLLSCVTPLGWLGRMIQFKEKSRKQGEDVRTGLMTYPVLMAADILLYQADLVPVGEDQKQHLELTRDIADKFNNEFGGKPWKKRGGRGGRVFKVPEVFIPPAGARIMSLQDGTAKMSKSAENDNTRINLTDTPDQIANKIKRCKTDAVDGLEWGHPDRPEATNLLTIYSLCTGKSKDEVLADVGGMRWGGFKPVLTEAVVEHLRPLQTKYGQLMSDVSYIDSVLAAGAEAAAATADRTLADARDAMGFVPPFKRK
ncbi:hypothetical protein CHLRE_05g238322v5 [Chlamydomonas reinhardtii]|uniref:tryptophan--tRNA ligase n=1 Tax=Chlamydomonas reinhardtii TaxID=3055 RepID=A0A2K3DSZ3_CHLRE|nr:uncharacterized protein CHLRE_05g238322v5 [Chlamydomonas reinhardtii]PNW83659.1 hypothetical protein CHLRE_05g238322v5 [Chlamydomonas reinhardtii]